MFHDFNMIVFLTNRNETKRSRQHILEISHFFGLQQEEFNSLSIPQQLDVTDVELDNIALL